MDRIVLCMKWGGLYGPDYVTVLASAVRAHLDGPVRVVCLTDDPTGIGAEVECLPIPDLGLPPRMWAGGAWPKIALFGHDLHGLRGRAVFIDLDMVICGDLSELFTHGEGLMAIDEGPWNRAPAPQTMSALMAFDLGAMGYLVDRLRADPEGMAARYRIEQNYLHHEARPLGHWPGGWVLSYKRHLRRAVLVDRVLEPLPPPPGAKVVAFHGRPRPADLLRDGRGNRDRWPHRLSWPVGWMRDYWLRHGGRLPE
ncbi:MAG: hypothetical protein ACXIUV_04370 [Alkalilacustris sp.]